MSDAISGRQRLATLAERTQGKGDPFARFVGYRNRRNRRRRVGAIVVAIALATAVTALLGETFRGASSRPADRPGSPVWITRFENLPGAELSNVAANGSGLFVSETEGRPNDRAFVWKFDDAGGQLWKRPAGNAGYGVATDDTGVYVTGWTDAALNGQEYLGGGTDAFVEKYDNDGNLAWSREFGTGTVEYATSVTVDRTGVYVAGDTYGALPDAAHVGPKCGSCADAFVVKYDLEGNELWARQFGTRGWDQAGTVTASSDEIYVGGTADNQGGWVWKISNDGEILWSRHLMPHGSVRSIARYGASVYVAGTVGHDGSVGKYTSDGDEVWVSRFGSDRTDEVNAIAVDASGIYAAGKTDFDYVRQGLGWRTVGSADPYVAKYDDDGALVWSQTVPNTGEAGFTGLALSRGELLAAGNADGRFRYASTGNGGGFVTRVNLSTTTS